MFEPYEVAVSAAAMERGAKSVPSSSTLDVGALKKLRLFM